MTRKDFELIAETIRNLSYPSMRGGPIDRNDLKFIAESFAQSLKQTNPRFKPDTFVEACLKEK